MRLVLPVILAVGCTYPPLGQEDAVPELQDSRLDATITVYGESEFRVGYTGSDGNFNERCVFNRLIEGFVPEETPVGCETCSDYFVLAFREEEDDSDDRCSWAPTAALHLGFGDLVGFPEGDYPNTWNWLGEEDAIGIIRSDWNPGGFADTVRSQYVIGLFESTDGLDLGYSRSYHFENYPNYSFAGPTGATVQAGNQRLPAVIKWSSSLWIR